MRSIEPTRRQAMAGALAATVAGLGACAAPSPETPAAGKAAATDFVLVHGAWHGSWCWRRVADLLAAAGHRVWARERVRSLVYLDAHVPLAGQSMVDISGRAVAETFERMAAPSAGLSVPPLPARVFGVSDVDAPWVNSKLTPHPYSTFKGIVASVQGLERIPMKTYVRAQRFANASFENNMKRYATQPGWTVIQLQEGHDLMITVPRQTADILIGAAA